MTSRVERTSKDKTVFSSPWQFLWLKNKRTRTKKRKTSSSLYFVVRRNRRSVIAVMIPQCTVSPYRAQIAANVLYKAEYTLSVWHACHVRGAVRCLQRDLVGGDPSWSSEWTGPVASPFLPLSHHTPQARPPSTILPAHGCWVSCMQVPGPACVVIVVVL